jgi:predicted PurR-regulated permease PerM
LAPSAKAFMGESFESHRIFLEISKMLKSFFLGNLIIGLLMAAVFSILFSALGLKNSVSLGLITGFLNLIPLIGPFLSIVLPIAAGLLQFSSPGPFIIMAAVIFFLHFFTANFVVPKIVGGHINVNAIASTLSLIFWGWLWGAIGVLIAIPLTALLRIFLENYKPTMTLAALLSDTKNSNQKNKG